MQISPLVVLAGIPGQSTHGLRSTPHRRPHSAPALPNNNSYQQGCTSWHRQQRLCAHVAGPPSGVPGGIGTKWDRSREPATKTPRTPESLEGVVFSECGGGEPSNLSRIKLMMAGDVESNPGPPCAACNRAIRINTVPLQCGGCGGAVHASCSGLTRREVARGCPFECPRCRGEHRRTEEVEEERRPCVVCGELLRRGATYAGCECGQRAHKKCTGLPRGSTGEWSCPRCVNAGEGQEEEEEEEELEAGD